jgi:hypothetical protein
MAIKLTFHALISLPVIFTEPVEIRIVCFYEQKAQEFEVILYGFIGMELDLGNFFKF